MSSLASFPAFKLLPYQNAHAPLCNSISLQRTSSWMYCGPLLPLLEPQLPPSYHEWHKATVKGDLTADLLPFLSYANSFLSAAGLSHYWLSIRATTPTTDYDEPRWHTDDDFFHSEKLIRTQWKLVTTLLGPGTLFIEDANSARAIEAKTKQESRDACKDHLCNPFNCLGCATASADIRHRLSDRFEKEEVIQAADGHCCFFRIGQEQGAVHSEPPHDCDRVFVNIVPGTEDEIQKLMAKWGMTTFPRAWSVGLPMRAH
ncbi:hypothetical protein FKW77_010457 [Venturia effusa]|uniref:Uncharacterized protein n=1 Tax=Venturia effusa TaxID=50376 RepID=A0A517L0H7_9PEZI|nr:hypothetical protein FKW77_010457 [Venturia effusa]